MTHRAKRITAVLAVILAVILIATPAAAVTNGAAPPTPEAEETPDDNPECENESKKEPSDTDENGSDEAFFDVEDADAERTDDNVTVSATVENTGDEGDTQNVSFSLESEEANVSTGAVDIVFLVDNSGSVIEEIGTINDELDNFTNELDDRGIDARYGVVTFTNEIETNQQFTSNVTDTQNTLDEVEADVGGGDEFSYPAINETVQSERDLDPRSDAQTVYIVLTDEDSDFQDEPTDVTDYREQLGDSLEEENVALFAVSPPVSQLELDSEEERAVSTLANETDDGQFFNLADDFGDQFVLNVSEGVANVTEGNQQEVTLDGNESTTVEFTVDGDAVPEGEYNVTVSSEDDADSAEVTIEEA